MLAAVAAVLVAGGLHVVAEPDVEGGKDHPSVKRYEGSTIAIYTQYDYNEYTLPLGKALEYDFNKKRTRFEKSEALEGKVTRISYLVPMGRSGLEVFRNYKTALEAAGMEILFEAKPDELGNNDAFMSSYAGIGTQLLEYSRGGPRYIAARGQKGTSVIHVAVMVTPYEMGATSVQVKKDQVIVQVDVIESKMMDEKMVRVKPLEMADMQTALAADGRVVLYGVAFEDDKADIKPESKGTLEEIAKFLKAQPKLRLLLVAHTDSSLDPEHQRILTEKRAQAAVAELERTYGVEAGRLRAVGAGLTAPAASNRTPEGRARNVRLELVEF